MLVTFFGIVLVILAVAFVAMIYLVGTPRDLLEWSTVFVLGLFASIAGYGGIRLLIRAYETAYGG